MEASRVYLDLYTACLLLHYQYNINYTWNYTDYDVDHVRLAYIAPYWFILIEIFLSIVCFVYFSDGNCTLLNCFYQLQNCHVPWDIFEYNMFDVTMFKWADQPATEQSNKVSEHSLEVQISICNTHVSWIAEPQEWWQTLIPGGVRWLLPIFLPDGCVQPK